MSASAYLLCLFFVCLSATPVGSGPGLLLNYWNLRILTYLLQYVFPSATSSGTYKRAPNSFLFSLVNPSGFKPAKMPLIQGKEGSAIYCQSGYGPVFGSNTSGYFDLSIGNSPTQSGGCQSNLNNSYRCPEGQNTATFLCGNYAFAVTEIEVFVFEK